MQITLDFERFVDQAYRAFSCVHYEVAEPVQGTPLAGKGLTLESDFEDLKDRVHEMLFARESYRFEQVIHVPHHEHG